MPTDPRDEQEIEIKCPKCREVVKIPAAQADTTMRARCSKGHEFEIAKAI